ncbi:MAG: hypothetical protein JOZ29_03925 [Deltaproteobacteria bacterium]|nr:hypothetical protein [Deltaproteobacteria bacterium]
MKISTTPVQPILQLNLQMNLWPLRARGITAVPAEHQKELRLALMELLIQAVQGHLEYQTDGVDHESPEAHS